MTYFDNLKGVIVKTEEYCSNDDIVNRFVTEYSSSVQIVGADNAWVYNVKDEKTYDRKGQLMSTNTVRVNNRQVNVGLTTADFQ